MDLRIHKLLYSIESQSPSPTSSLHSSQPSHNGFPIIAVAIIGIFAITLLLLSYYIFVTKCCLNLQRIDIITHFSISGRSRVQDLSTIYNPETVNRGLDEAEIRSIPTIQYRKGERNCRDCAVCLIEFQEQEKLRITPNCGHFFHIDCLDIWLQNKTNCPLCRTSISAPKDQQLPQDYCIAIETNRLSSSSRQLEEKLCRKVSCGDECISSTEKEEEFRVEVIRRSFSMDSAADSQLYLSAQQIIQQRSQFTDHEGSSSRIKRSFFSFGQGYWSSRNAVLPFSLDQ